jgi:hypothetical protein
MTDVARVTAVWTGFTGAPGYSNFHFTSLDTDTARNSAGAAVRTFFAAFGAYLASTWTITVQPNIKVFDMTSGKLIREDTMTTPPAVLPGSSAAVAYAGGAGLVVRWNTGLIYNGRRVRGRTYMVPLQGVSQSDGTLASAVITAAVNAGNALIANTPADFAIWAKLFDKTSGKPVQVGGGIAPADTCAVTDQTGILKSRRS